LRKLSFGDIVAGMTRSVFQQIGRVLWGSQPFAQMARDMGLSRATVNRYAVGTVPIPLSAWKTLGKLLRTRRAQIDHYIDKLPPEAR